MRRLAPDLAIVAVLAALFLAAFYNLPDHEPYFYDEADYVAAATKGFSANILERPSMSVIEFIRTGMDRTMRTKRTGLSDIVRGAHDITFYRHYHGPAYFYWLSAVGPLVHFDEYAMRLSGLAWHMVLFAIIYFGVLLLATSRIAALLAGCLFLFGQFNIATDVQVTPHISYVLFTMLALFLFARYIQTGSLRVWYASVAAFAAAFCSVEYAILLPLTAVCTLTVYRHRRLSGKAVLRSFLLLAACLLVLWPIGLLELSALKGYFSIAYLAVQRTGVYGDGTPFSVWIRHANDAPVEFAAIFAGLALWAGLRMRPLTPALFPFAAYSSLMLLTTIKNRSLNPTYISSILPPLFVIAGIAIGAALQLAKLPVRVALSACLLLVTAAGGYQLILRKSAGAMYRPEEGIIAGLREANLEESSILVPSDFLPAISYYFPKMEVHSYLKTDDARELTEKFANYKVRAIIGLETSPIRNALIGRIHIAFVPVFNAPGYNIIHVDATH